MKELQQKIKFWVESCSISIWKNLYFRRASFKAEPFVNFARPHSATHGLIYFSWLWNVIFLIPWKYFHIATKHFFQNYRIQCSTLEKIQNSKSYFLRFLFVLLLILLLLLLLLLYWANTVKLYWKLLLKSSHNQQP